MNVKGTVVTEYCAASRILMRNGFNNIGLTKLITTQFTTMDQEESKQNLILLS